MTTTKPVPGGLLGKEPAGTIGSSISFILLGLWMILKASGVDVTEDMSGAVDLIIYGLISVPAIGGWLTRFFVYSPATAQKEVNKAAATGVAPDMSPPPPTENVTNVPPEKWGINRGKGGA